MYVTFEQAFNIGKVVKVNDEGKKPKDDRFVDQICFPLFGVLKAMNVTKVDYFSLDVEGNEMDILRTIPFDDVDITVEYFYSLLLRGHCNFRLHILH